MLILVSLKNKIFGELILARVTVCIQPEGTRCKVSMGSIAAVVELACAALACQPDVQFADATPLPSLILSTVLLTGYHVRSTEYGIETYKCFSVISRFMIVKEGGRAGWGVLVCEPGLHD